jgi:hypothetical protein
MTPSEIWWLTQSLNLSGNFIEAAALTRITWEWPKPEDYDAALDRMNNSVECLKITISANMMPALMALADMSAKLAKLQ